jgi:Holliday junction DNA helicase RuvB
VTAAVAPPAPAPAAAPADPVLAARSLEELPGELSAAEWRRLEGRLDWSPQRKAFLFRPEAEIFSGFRDLLPGRSGGGGSADDTRVSSELPAPRDPRVSSAGAAGSSLRPAELAAFVGQRRAVENLELAARAARRRGAPLGHVLLSGPGGLGKTTLARIIAHEMDAPLQSALGPLIEQPAQLIGLLGRLPEGGVFFIDEVHRLPRSCMECLYGALEDGVIDVPLAEGSRTRTVRLRLERFTLVGATTRPGALEAPFRDRFRIQERLELYGRGELAELIERAAPRLGARIDADAADGIARRSRGVPREALRLLERARDVAESRVEREGGADLAGDLAGDLATAIAAADVEEAAGRLGIDAHGLWPDDRRIVELLLDCSRPLGLGAIASTLGLDRETVRRVHEPHLLAAGWILRGPRGREATLKARARYGTRAARSPSCA